MRLSSCGESSIEVDQHLVPAERGRQRCGVEGAAQASPSTGDMPLAFVLSAVIVEGSEPCQRCRLLAADAAEFGHSDNNGERGAFADAGHAEHEIEPAGEIVMIAQPSDDPEQFRAPPRFQAGDVGDDDLAGCGRRRHARAGS